MGKIDINQLKKIREVTGAGVVDCQRALAESDGDEARALTWLREKGLQSASKKAEREVESGLVWSYTHAEGRILAVVELACETDFVARTDEFKQLANELAMQVAAMAPLTVDELLAQPYIRDESKKTGDLVTGLVAKLGENILVRRVARFELGEEIA